MPLTGDAVEHKVAVGPVQISIREIDAETGGGAAQGRLYGGGGGVAEQIEQTPARSQPGNQAPYRPMIQEQPGIEVRRQIHFKYRVPLPHLEHAQVAAVAQGLILTGPGLALAALGEYQARVWLQHLGDGRCHLTQAASGGGLGHAGGRCIFLHMHSLAVAVDRHGVLRQIGVIEPVALNPFPRHPGREPAAILAQPVGEHGDARAMLFGPHCVEFPCRRGLLRRVNRTDQ